MLAYLLILCFATLTLGEICPPEGEMDVKIERPTERLSNEVIPLWYNLTLVPNFELENFTGSVSIEIKALNKTRRIQIHIKGLDVKQTDVTVTCDDENIFSNLTQDSEISTINLKKDILINKRCMLDFKKFAGVLSDTVFEGLYLARYDENGTTKTFATTQFESRGARRAFPCFDEPALKATFSVNLVRPKNYITISNEELDYSIEKAKTIVDVYKETELMSTYLLAFIITQYKSTNVKLGQRVFADEPAIRNGEANYALNMGVDIFYALEKYTEFKYSFSKLDQIGIPDNYFSPGAMENWGLVTYRKSAIVYPYDQQVTKGLQKTVGIISHEYSHQWFGNVVTCSLWKYLWLNEGFADYFEYFASSMVGWDLKDIFVMDSVHGALAQDSVKTTVSMNTEGAPSYIPYQKAGSVIRMMSHIVTEELFQKSLALYLSLNQYKAATPDDLYKAFDTVVANENKTELLGGRKFADIMKTWDNQAGYPILDVTKEEDKITIKQQRFFTDEGTNNTQSWVIPLTYVLEGKDFSNTTAIDWINSLDSKVLNNITSGWVIFNTQQMGFYRVMYDENNWNLLTNQLSERDHNQIHLLNRAQLIDDGFTFAKINKMNYSVALELSKYLTKEQEYVPIAVFLKHIAEMNDKLAEENGRDLFKFFMEHIFTGSVLNEVTFEEKINDTHKTKYLRIELINWLCRLGYQECTQYALDTFKNNSTISPDLQEPIYCGAMRTGTNDDWNTLFEKYNKSETNDLSRPRIINALGCAENSEILTSYIDKILEPSNKIAALSGLRSILNAGDFGLQFLFNYTTNNFTKLKPLNDIHTIIKDMGGKLNTQDHADAFVTLNSSNPEFNATFTEAINKIQVNIKWNTDNKEDLQSWFTEYKEYVENSAISVQVNFTFLLGALFATIIVNHLK